MTLMATASRSASEMPLAIARYFEAIVFDWDGTAVADRRVDATRTCRPGRPCRAGRRWLGVTEA
jgi:hypothetical protein